jgi:hypothetical protein
VPVAVNCFVVPLAIDGFVGEIWIETSSAAVTVRIEAGLVIAPSVEVMFVVPAFADVASPLEPSELDIDAVPVVPEFQVTTLVKFCVELSVYVPVAVNCFVVPFAIDGFVGVTWIETSVAEVTVRVFVGLVIAPRAAVIFDVPELTDVASPLEPSALEIIAVPDVAEFQVTEFVRFCVDSSV